MCVCTCSCPFTVLKSSAFFSRLCTHTFLFCLQRDAAARFLSRNFRLFSSGSSLVVLRRRPPVVVVCWAGGAGDTCRHGPTIKHTNTNQLALFSGIFISHVQPKAAPDKRRREKKTYQLYIAFDKMFSKY